MSYFLPSFFQKRLLRYLLTRLDFLDSNDLDLDNLGLTWGQRTVVELKHVGIKTKRIADILQLPPTVALTHASINILRLTIPSDLHISGIEVEVEGVEAIISLRPDLAADAAETTSRAKDGRAQDNHGQSYRSWTSRPAMHDPGGRSRRGGPAEHSQVLPTTEDLAASFLEAESPHERDELQAAMESQSQIHLEESTVSSASSEDVGLGMQGGLSLPTFVANFLAGVADRLSVTVKDVSILLEPAFPAPSAAPADSTKFMLSVSNVTVEAVQQTDNGEIKREARRAVSITDTQLFVLSESETFSDFSGLNSPRLSRSRPRLPHVGSALSDNSDQAISSNASLSQQSSSSRPPADYLSRSDFEVALEESALLSSNLFQSPARSAYDEADAWEESTPTDNRAYAKSYPVSASTHISGSVTSRDLQDHTEDLAESKTFTHDEAESMYMSAMSEPLHMPGGFDTSQYDTPLRTQSISDPSRGDKKSPVALAEETHSTFTQPQASGQAAVVSGESMIDPSLASYFQSRILHVDALRLKIPGPHQSEVTLATERFTSPQRPSHASQFRQAGGATQLSSSGAVTGLRSVDSFQAREASAKILDVDIGTVTLDLDIVVCRILARTAQLASEIFTQPASTKKQMSTSHTNQSLEVNVGESRLNYCETVLKKPFSKAGLQTVDSLLADQQTLFTLSFSSTKYCIEPLEQNQRLSVAKIAMRHGTREVLSFVDSVNVRDSIASSAMLRPHDLSITITGTRYAVQVKPVHVVLDLLVIDDVLSKSGGLSSLLDLGNSIASTATVKGASRVAPNPAKVRTVRFSEPHGRPRGDSDPKSLPPKVDVRISGTIIDLIGSQSSLQVKTSAIKIAYRDNNVRLVIDGAAVEGPLLTLESPRGDVYAKIRQVELYYSNSPTDEDLDRLLSLITPSNDKYDQDDDIMVDTLLRQRRKGGVLRLTVGDLSLGATGTRWTPRLAKVIDEISKLSSVTKYLPEDDRPGVLTFALLKKLNCRFDVDDTFGPLKLQAELLEGAQINVPSLVAAQVASWTLSRHDKDIMIADVLPQSNLVMGPPMLMCRFIADEMEPTVRFKLSNTCVEYNVPTLVALTALIERLKAEGQDADLDSVASHTSSPSLSSASGGDVLARKIRFAVAFRDSAIALNPSNSSAKGLFVLTDAIIKHENQKRGSVDNLELKKASLLIINNAATVGLSSGNIDHKLYFEENDQIQQLTKAGFVPVGSISSAYANVNIVEDRVTAETQVDVEFRNNLLFLETCADSTQTMIQILSGLAPPPAPSLVAKYRTEIVPIQDMLASFTGNAFVSEPGPELGLQASRATVQAASTTDELDYSDEEEDNDFSGMYGNVDDADDEMTASHVESDLGQSAMSESIHIAPVQVTSSDAGDAGESVMMHSMLDFRNEHFVPKSTVGGTAHRWNSDQNTYGLASDGAFDRSPLRIRVRDVHIIWNLFDGYDWQTTRDTISQAVKEIENKALARRPRSANRIATAEDEEESVIGDFLFNSIYIGIPANKDPRELASAINHDIDDMVSETGSYATGTTITTATSRRPSSTIPRQRKLKLQRSKHHKMAIELTGVSADFLAFPPGSGEVQSSIDVRVKKLEIFDHIPTSTWKKFVTYMQDAGEREHGANMVHIELLNVKPVADLSASEMVLKISVLPLRLHVDQDALDFLARFFEFKDDSAPASDDPSNPPFLQRVEVNAVQVKLDYKPKKVDYAALRSGRTTEFMNFIVLDRADMVLRRVILYGVSGFERLGLMLNAIWSPDVKRNQLAGVLAGLAPVRPLVDVTSGVRELVAVPMREYRKDGRIVRSIQKGAFAFAKTTATELVNLGAKMAIGTQQILQNTEEIFVPREQQHGDNEQDEARKQISLYADQPIGIRQGLRSAYSSLERDLLIAKDAIVAVPGEVMASSSAKGAAAAILKQSPTIILRPAIGASKAIGQTLLGAGNTLDRENLRRIDEKYKRH